MKAIHQRFSAAASPPVQEWPVVPCAAAGALELVLMIISAVFRFLLSPIAPLHQCLDRSRGGSCFDAMLA
jgi:hypothetical protein